MSKKFELSKDEIIEKVSEMFRVERNKVYESRDKWVELLNMFNDKHRKFTRSELNRLEVEITHHREMEELYEVSADAIERVREMLMQLKEEK